MRDSTDGAGRRARRPRRAGLVALAATVLSAGMAMGAPADLDPGFGERGRVLIDSGRPDDAMAVAVQRDGGIVVGGQAGTDPAAYRLNADGSPDRGFGTGGVRLLPTLEADQARAMTLQPDGRILLAGRTPLGAGNGLVARLSATDGAPDRSFGEDGSVTGIDSGGDETLQAVATAPDGRIVVAGLSSVATQAVVYRLTPAGAPDRTFDGDGARGIDLGATEAALTAAVQPDGKIVVGGFTTGPVDSAGFVARFTEAGAPDPAFGGGDGVALIGSLDTVAAVALQPDGRIALAGGAGNDMAAGRLTAGGAPDRSFGGGGVVRFENEADEHATAITLQPDGKVLIAGYIYPADARALVHRLLPDGSPDPSFGVDGLLATGVGGAQEGAWAIALQPDGRIVLAGHTEDGGDVIVLRLDGDRPGTAAGGGTAGPGTASGGGTTGAPQVVRCAGRTATIVGTPRADRLRGTAGPDVIAGLGGGDVIRGLGGDDLVCGGPGDDLVMGGPGRDTLRGDAGRDRLIGGAGRDRLLGGAGRDAARQ